MEAVGTPEVRMPVLFIGHGSPLNMVLENRFTRGLADLGAFLPRPDAIMVVSAHWLTRGSFVACVDRPGMIYDFFGFPDELYRVRYECSGAPALARQVTELGGGAVRCDPARGLDHAAYAVLRHLFPSAEIPVFELSLDYSFGDPHPKPVGYHYEIAKRLAPLRDMGVLVIGSGNMVHNLALADPDMDAPPFGWAVKADEQMRSHLIREEHRRLIDFPSAGEWGSRAVPTLDHYLPMIYAVALQEEGEDLRFTHAGFQNGSVSMRGFRIG